MFRGRRYEWRQVFEFVTKMLECEVLAWKLFISEVQYTWKFWLHVLKENIKVSVRWLETWRQSFWIRYTTAQFCPWNNDEYGQCVRIGLYVQLQINFTSCSSISLGFSYRVEECVVLFPDSPVTGKYKTNAFLILSRNCAYWNWCNEDVVKFLSLLITKVVK